MAPTSDRPRRFAPLAMVLLAGCAADPTGPLTAGLWGGTGVSFAVSVDSTVVEFDCAHGVVRGLIRMEEGRFRETGDFVLEHGGPIREDEPPDLRAAVYQGAVAGGDLELTVRVEGIAQVLGPYRLRHGAPPILRKCL